MISYTSFSTECLDDSYLIAANRRRHQCAQWNAQDKGRPSGTILKAQSQSGTRFLVELRAHFVHHGCSSNIFVQHIMVDVSDFIVAHTLNNKQVQTAPLWQCAKNFENVIETLIQILFMIYMNDTYSCFPLHPQQWNIQSFLSRAGVEQAKQAMDLWHGIIICALTSIVSATHY